MASQAAAETNDHKATVREEFTRQAQAYAGRRQSGVQPIRGNVL